MHRVEDVLALDADLQAVALALGGQLPGQVGEGLGAGRGVHQHYHGEVVLQDRLADVQHVYAALGEQLADEGDNAHAVLTDDCNYGFHFRSSSDMVPSSSRFFSKAGMKFSRK